MANELSDVDKDVENIKAIVRKSFARLYAALKARELTTLRQLDAVIRQCQNNKGLQRDCIQNIQISYENESTLFENIGKYGVIDFKKLNFDSHTFTLEDYVSPNDDHMYSYKTIEELTKEEDSNDLLAIEEAALRQITNHENCVCYVNIRSDEVSKKFRELHPIANEISSIDNSNTHPADINDISSELLTKTDAESSISDTDIVKIDPTDDWLNSIKSQTEIEPTQVTDVMEYSTITCS